MLVFLSNSLLNLLLLALETLFKIKAADTRRNHNNKMYKVSLFLTDAARLPATLDHHLHPTSWFAEHTRFFYVPVGR